jgi:hypothetical protein
MFRNGYGLAALIAIALLSGCNEMKVAEKEHPATLEDSGQQGIMKIRLTEKAAERTGIETTQVREEVVSSPSGDVTRKVIPYGAIMYDKKGATWTFTSPEPLVYMRHAVSVERIDGQKVILADGPPAGTTVVTVGAAELMGAEHKYGH